MLSYLGYLNNAAVNFYGAYIFSNYCLLFSLNKYPGVEWLNHMIAAFDFLRNLHTLMAAALYSAINSVPFFPTSLPFFIELCGFSDTDLYELFIYFRH